MKKKLRRMMREIERRGGVLHVAEDCPEDLTEIFLQQVLDCPDCIREAKRNGLLGDPIWNSLKEH